MRQRFTDKYDYYVIPHVKQPRKQTRISPNASPIRSALADINATFEELKNDDDLHTTFIL